MGKQRTGDAKAVEISARVATRTHAKERVITPLLQAGTIDQHRLSLLKALSHPTYRW
jgi:hypothetical protein